MMKDCSKRKRTRQEMEEVKDFEKSLKEDRQIFLQDTKRLKMERDSLMHTVQEMSQKEEALRRLYENGIVDEDGNPLVQLVMGVPNEIYNSE